VYSGDSDNHASTSAVLSQTVNASNATTTALSSSVNPLPLEQNTILTATVTPITATGSVTFKDGANTIGTITLSAGVARLAAGFSTTGVHSLTAVYAGSASFAGSTSVVLSQGVNKANSSTALSSGTNPSTVGQPVTLSATVSGVNPSGTATFLDGAVPLGSAPLNAAGVATLTTRFASTSSHSLTVVYAGDASNNPSTSAALSQSVSTTASTTTLISSANPAVAGQTVTLSASVTGASPTGVVTFNDGTTTLGTGTLSAGVATLTTSFSPAVARSLTAVYAGDTANAGSTSGVLSQNVNKANSTAALSSDPNPSAVNQSVMLRATVSGVNPGGTVTFLDGAVPLGSATLSASGGAALTTSFASTSLHSLTVVYAGDASNNPSTSAALSQDVNTASSTITLSSSANPSAAGQFVTLSANVTGAGPTGIVSFKDGTATIGTATLNAGVAALATSFSAAGAHSLTAVYAGDAANAGSTSAGISQTVTANATTTTLSSTVNPTAVGQNTTLSAAVTPATATGSVTFREGTITLGSATLNAGVATLETSFAGAGNHILSASYGGDAGNDPSTSAAGTQIVNAASTSISLSATPNPSTEGASIVLTATVSATISGGAGPSGSVSFSDGAVVLGSASVASGQASLATVLNGAGAHSLSASYGGDANNAASSSGALSVQVNGAPALPPPPSAALPVIDYEYDAQGNRTRVIQARSVAGFNFATVQSYDALNRAKDSTDPKLGVTRFAYDALDRVLQVTDPRNLVTQSPRNGLGDTTQLVSPDTGSAAFTYDAAGNLHGLQPERPDEPDPYLGLRPERCRVCQRRRAPDLHRPPQRLDPVQLRPAGQGAHRHPARERAGRGERGNDRQHRELRLRQRRPCHEHHLPLGAPTERDLHRRSAQRHRPGQGPGQRRDGPDQRHPVGAVRCAPELGVAAGHGNAKPQPGVRRRRAARALPAGRSGARRHVRRGGPHQRLQPPRRGHGSAQRGRDRAGPELCVRRAEPAHEHQHGERKLEHRL